jgi:hypothetical protein
MDTYQNGNYGDPAADHMAIISNGSVDHHGANNLTGPITLPNIEDCKNHCLNISWNPATLALTATLDNFKYQLCRRYQADYR